MNFSTQLMNSLIPTPNNYNGPIPTWAELFCGGVLILFGFIFVAFLVWAFKELMR